VEEVAHVVEAREVDVAVLLALVLLPPDGVLLVLPNRERRQAQPKPESKRTSGEGGRDGWRLRGWCRRLASSPSASAAAARVASGMFGEPGFGVVVPAGRFLRASRPPAPKICSPKTRSSNREHGLRS
jgi:hypothetical protein